MSGIFGKKQVLLATLVVALGVAVYLNYYFSVKQPNVLDADASRTTSSADNLGDAQYVNGSVSPEQAGNADDYFGNARKNRENARTEAMEIVKELMNDVKATDAMKKQGLEKTVAMAEAVERESKIESLIKAKGFADCVVYIEEKNCHVVVKSDGLQPQQTMQITEIITAQSKIVAENIKILTAK